MHFHTKRLIGVVILAFLAGIAYFFVHNLAPVNADGTSLVFEIKPGEGFRTVAGNLYGKGLIRSQAAFESFSVLDGKAFKFQPGLYPLSPSMGALQIMDTISGTSRKVVSVTIPEGSTLFDIDRILGAASVIRPGSFAEATSAQALEGKLFPDTYDFFIGSDVDTILQKMTDDFNAKAEPLLAADGNKGADDLIIASLLEKEVATSSDQAIVAGILEKRLTIGMALDVDATVCYIKEQQHPASTTTCSVSASDFKIDSPYNTYLYKGLPPTPIDNPGIATIAAAIHPQSSPYLYYLTDPKTGKTIYAKTLSEQEANQKKYLQ